MSIQVAPKIQKTRDSNFPQFLFEWHELTGKVYVIGLPGRFEDRVFVPATCGQARAFVLAEHCDTHGRFFGFVQTYLRGYRQGAADEKLKSAGESNVPIGYGVGPVVVTAGITRGRCNG